MSRGRRGHREYDKRRRTLSRGSRGKPVAGVRNLTNGGVNLVMPDNYSAHLETGTTNGNVKSDFPLNVPLNERGRMPKEISVDIGSGGATIRAVTTNGGVNLSRASSM